MRTRPDVVEQAGVSVTIASYVMNNSRYVDREKRNGVTDAFTDWCRPLLGGPLRSFAQLRE